MLESMLYHHLMFGSYGHSDAWCPRCRSFSACGGDGFGMLRCRNCATYYGLEISDRGASGRQSLRGFFKSKILPMFQRKNPKAFEAVTEAGD